MPKNDKPVKKKLPAKKLPAKESKNGAMRGAALPPRANTDPDATVLDRLHGVVVERRNADPALSHSARLLLRGTPKIAQKFGEEAVECLIEAVAGNRAALIGESADVLYHLTVLWVDAGIRPDEVWAELVRREGVSGIAEKAARPIARALGIGTRKIP
jgi:phosphoribosyl-ATP pyrophosphohydrolase